MELKDLIKVRPLPISAALMQIFFGVFLFFAIISPTEEAAGCPFWLRTGFAILTFVASGYMWYDWAFKASYWLKHERNT